MAIAFDAKTQNTSSFDGSTLTASHTIGAITNPGILVYVGFEHTAPRTITATYDGNAMTEIANAVQTPGTNDIGVYAFFINAPSTGAGDAVATWNADAQARWIAAVSYAGVDQSDAVGASNTAVGNSTTPSVSVTTGQDNSFIVGGYTFMGGDADPSTPDDTERWDLATGTTAFNDCASAGGDKLQASAGAGTISMTASVSDEWCMVGVELKAAAAAAAPTGRMLRAFFDRQWEMINGVLRPRRGIYLPNGMFLAI